MEILAPLHLAVEHEAAQLKHPVVPPKMVSFVLPWALKTRFSRQMSRMAIILGLIVSSVLTEVMFPNIAKAGILPVGEVLEEGSTNALVTELQSQLKAKGFFNENITGYYGSLTAEAVARYQRSVGLPADGVFGPQTDAALFDGILPGQSFTPQGFSPSAVTPATGFRLGDRPLKIGDQGSDVSELQRLLNERVGYTAIDGDFGSATKARVIQFQQFRGLTPNGVAGATTITALRNQPSGQIPTGSNPPTSSEARRASENAASINRGQYLVVIPTDADNRSQLTFVRATQPSACMTRSRRGSYIFAGGYPNFSSAESMRLQLRSTRQTVETSRLDARIDYTQDNDFTIECLY